MSTQVTSTALLSCPFGTVPTPLNILPTGKTMGTNMPAGTILDNKPFVNVTGFVLCTSPANPSVIAAMGAPMPCVPVLTAPWVPGSPTVLIKGKPALSSSCKLICAWAGAIGCTTPGTAVTVQVP